MRRLSAVLALLVLVAHPRVYTGPMAQDDDPCGGVWTGTVTYDVTDTGSLSNEQRVGDDAHGVKATRKATAKTSIGITYTVTLEESQRTPGARVVVRANGDIATEETGQMHCTGRGWVGFSARGSSTRTVTANEEVPASFALTTNDKGVRISVGTDDYHVTASQTGTASNSGGCNPAGDAPPRWPEAEGTTRIRVNGLDLVADVPSAPQQVGPNEFVFAGTWTNPHPVADVPLFIPVTEWKAAATLKWDLRYREDARLTPAARALQREMSGAFMEYQGVQVSPDLIEITDVGAVPGAHMEFTIRLSGGNCILPRHSCLAQAIRGGGVAPGSLQGAQRFLAGSVVRTGADFGVNARVVSVETGEIIAASSEVESQGSTLTVQRAITTALRDLGIRFCGPSR